MTEISFVFVDGSKAKFRTMSTRSDLLEFLASLEGSKEFFSIYEEDDTLTFFRLDQIRRFSIKEIAVV